MTPATRATPASVSRWAASQSSWWQSSRASCQGRVARVLLPELGGMKTCWWMLGVEMNGRRQDFRVVDRCGDVVPFRQTRRMRPCGARGDRGRTSRRSHLMGVGATTSGST